MPLLRRFWLIALLGLILIARLLVAETEAERMNRLIAQLGSAKFAERRAATEALDDIGEPALEALRRAATADMDPEIRQRAGVLAAAIDGRFTTGRVFAERVLKGTHLFHENFAIEINEGLLVAHTVRGLFAQLKEEVPPNLVTRLKAVKDLDEKQLGGLLRDSRLRLNARKELESGKDFTLAMRALLSQFDPNGAYLDRDERGPTCILRESWYSIGVQLHIDSATNMIQVVTPFKEGPAYKAGVRADDLIEAIIQTHDGDKIIFDPPRVTSLKGVAVEEASRMLLGRPKSTVRLRVRRAGEKKSVELDIPRGPAQPETILANRRKENDDGDFLIDPERKIGYIRITQFTRPTIRDIKRTVVELERDGLRGLVIDLRFNPGGLLQSAVDVADLFIDDGVILTVRPRRDPEAIFSGTHDGSRLDFPLACLVNGDSMSTAEVFAACLQDHRRAVIVGERTFGKGSVQNILDLEGGELKLTTAIFLRPNGKKIGKLKIPGRSDDEWGVTPDRGYRLDLSAEERERLRAHLDRQALIERRGQVKVNAPVFRDRQLELALESVRARMKKP